MKYDMSSLRNKIASLIPYLGTDVIYHLPRIEINSPHFFANRALFDRIVKREAIKDYPVQFAAIQVALRSTEIRLIDYDKSILWTHSLTTEDIAFYHDYFNHDAILEVAKILSMKKMDLSEELREDAENMMEFIRTKEGVKPMTEEKSTENNPLPNEKTALVWHKFHLKNDTTWPPKEMKTVLWHPISLKYGYVVCQHPDNVPGMVNHFDYWAEITVPDKLTIDCPCVNPAERIVENDNKSGFYVECLFCGRRGPIKRSAIEALEAWNHDRLK